MGATSSAAMELRAVGPSFQALYRDYFGFAWASLRRLGVPSAAIDDAAQDLWVTVHRRLASLDPAASVKAWLFAIARRVASHHRRAEYRHQRKLAAYSAAAPRAATTAVAQSEAALTMEVFLAKLDEDKRVAFVLSEVEGWSAPEIAAAVGAKPNTIYSRVRLARGQLRKYLQATETDLTESACVRALRRSTQPPPQASERCWLALAPSLAPAAAATAASASLLGKLKLVGLGVVLGSAGLAGIHALLPEPAPAPSAQPVQHPTTRPPAPESAPEPPPAQATPTPTPEPVEAPAAVVVPRRKAPPAPAAVAPTPVAEQPEAVVAETPADSLAEETRMLSTAKRKLAAGDADGALEIVGHHAEAYPTSSLRDVRQLLEVQALCGRGTKTLAREKAEAYAKATKAAAAERLRSACP